MCVWGGGGGANEGAAIINAALLIPRDCRALSYVMISTYSIGAVSLRILVHHLLSLAYCQQCTMLLDHKLPSLDKIFPFMVYHLS